MRFSARDGAVDISRRGARSRPAGLTEQCIGKLRASSPRFDSVSELVGVEHAQFPVLRLAQVQPR